MTDPRLEWRAVERRRVEAAARAAWPEECCGILLGRRHDAAATVRRVLPAANARPRDREHGYEIDPRDLVAAQRLARHEGLDIVGFYHSHPDGVPRPSREDARAAWPEASYVIVSLAAGATTLSSWRRQSDGRMVAERLVDSREAA
jgi:proteasome lid subunit RPN8/RPN11